MKAQSVLTRGVEERSQMDAIRERLETAGYEVKIGDAVDSRDRKQLVLATTAPYPVLRAARTGNLS